MSPNHRNLDRSQPVMPRQIQQLRVKPKSFNGLLVKDDLARFAPERLEPALGIHKWQPQDRPDNLVKNDPRKLPERRLMHRNQAPVHGARTNRDLMIS